MSTIANYVGSRIGDWATRDGVDLRKLRFVPGVAKHPLQRDGVEPVPRFAHLSPATRRV